MRFQKILFCLLAILPFTAFTTEEAAHEFSGKHFVASYLHCDPEAIRNLENLRQAMDEAVGACGATILQKNSHTFLPDGLTSVYLLSESHASIHTYPEFQACFVDLFTCGNNCSAERFDEILRKYLRPSEVNARFFLRNDTITEIPYTLGLEKVH